MVTLLYLIWHDNLMYQRFAFYTQGSQDSIDMKDPLPSQKGPFNH